MGNSPAPIKGGNLFLAWMVTSLGFPFGAVLARSVAGPMNDAVSAALGGLLAGAVIGAGQWLVLRGYLGIDVTWVVATASGLALGNTAGTVLTGTGTGLADQLFIGMAAGICVGVGQWTLLRERLQSAGLWVLVLAVAWPLGWTTTWSIGVDVSLGYAVFDAVGALVFAAVSGVALLLMVRNLSRAPAPTSAEKGSSGQGP